jgi:thiamine biosynthesis protein ThiI
MLIIVRYAEIGLKGKNRSFFERILVENINKKISGIVSRPRGRIIIRTENAGAVEKLKKIFGIDSFSIAKSVKLEMPEIMQSALEVINELSFGTFKVETQRINKQFPLKSPEISAEVGRFIEEKAGRTACMKSPDVVLRIEIFQKEAFIFTHWEKGLGGLPVGVSGRVLSLLSGGIDSPVSSLLMMKRGCSVDFVHFHNHPYVSRRSIDKVKALFTLLKQYQNGCRLYLFPLTSIQKEIVVKCPQKLRIILYRRMMVRIAERFCSKERYKAIISGESVGQVASQTLDNMVVISSAAKKLFLRPLVGMDKQEIIALAQKYGTYETSIIRHDDCCTFFAPRQAETHACLEEIEKAEALLEIEKLVNDCAENMEIIGL